MPITNETLSFRPSINVDAKTIRVTDTYPYGSEGYSWNARQVIGVLEITQSDIGEVVHSQDNFDFPDIKPVDAEPTSESEAYDLPTLPDGSITPGNYTVKYTVRVGFRVNISAAQGQSYTIINALNNYPELIQPGDVFVFTDPTNPDNAGSYVVATASPPSGILTTVTFVGGGPSGNGVLGSGFFYLVFTKTIQVNYKPSLKPLVSINQFHSCKDFTFTSIDETAYGNFFSLTRQHRVKSPQGILPQPPNDVVSENKTIVIGPGIYTQTYVSIVDSQVIYRQDDGLEIVFNVASSAEHNVQCFSNTLCDLKDCLTKLWNDYSVQFTTTGSSALGPTLLQVVSLIQQVSVQEECGNADAASEALGKVKDLLKSCGCECKDCGSNSETPVFIGGPSTKNVSASAVILQAIQGLDAQNAQEAFEVLFSLLSNFQEDQEQVNEVFTQSISEINEQVSELLQRKNWSARLSQPVGQNFEVSQVFNNSAQIQATVEVLGVGQGRISFTQDGQPFLLDGVEVYFQKAISAQVPSLAGALEVEVTSNQINLFGFDVAGAPVNGMFNGYINIVVNG